jgi:alpha-glucosidase
VENAVHAGVQSLFPYMSEDLGGHTADPTPEGYIRWIEYGALAPVYRPHCTHNHERMPWAFGPRAESIARNYLDMRYRLLPVFYAAAHENYETGEPLLRRLDLYFPQCSEARRDDEYLLGKDILVAPVLQAANGSQWQSDAAPDAIRILWIPPGDWIDAWTGETVSGPAMITNTVPLDKIPVYVRPGAVLPLAPQMPFTGEKPWDPITLDLYPRAGATGTATLYEDDTKTTAYRDGKYRATLISLAADDSAKTVTVDIAAADGTFHGELKKRSWVLRIHKPFGWPQIQAPAQVTVNGKKKHLPVLALPASRSAMPFGDVAGAPDGDTYEITLPAANVSKAMQVEVRF